MSNFFTIEQAQAALTGAYNAILKAQKAVKYEHEGPNIRTSIQRQDMQALQDSVDYWSNKCDEIEAGSSGVIISQAVVDYECI